MLLFLQMHGPQCSDLYIGYSSTGIVPAVSKYCNKIKNRNVMHNKKFMNW